MKKVLLVLIPILLVGGFFLLKGNGNAASGEVELPTARVEQSNIKSVIYVNGKIATEATRNVKPNTTALVKEILVKVGDKVKKGDVIAKMDSESLVNQLTAKKIQMEIEQAKLKRLEKGSDLTLNNSLKSAKSSLLSAEKKMKDDKALLSAGVISQNAYDASVKAYEDAKAQYENAAYGVNNSNRANELFIQRKSMESMANDISILEKKVEESNVKAPIDGVVTEIPATVGEAIQTNLMVISDFDQNVIKANISEADINKVKLGQKATITANSSKGKTYQGSVIFIAPGSKTVQGKKQAYVEIKLQLDTPAEELRTNFSVNMQLITAEKENIKVVSFEAVNQRANGEEYVLVSQADGSNKEVVVKTGITDDINVEIISDDINVGDLIQIKQTEDVQEENMMGLF